VKYWYPYAADQMETKMSARIFQVKKESVEITQDRPRRISARSRSTLLLMFADIIGFLVSAFLALSIRAIFNGGWRFDLYPQVIPVMIICLIFYSLVGLYPAFGLSGIEELHKLSTTTSLVVLALAAMTFWIRNATDYSRLTLSLTWIFSLLLLPLSRELMRVFGIRFEIWGENVAIIGHGKQGQWAVEFFLRNRLLGFNPLVIYDFNNTSIPEDNAIHIEKAKDLSGEERLNYIPGIETAIIIASDVPVNYINNLANNRQGGYQRLILIPNLEQISSFGVTSFDFGGVLGLEVRHNLQNKNQQTLKRIMDIGLTLLGSLFLSPILLIIMLLIKLSSKGVIFYKHTRVGRNGREFKAWKFRTMVVDADLKLNEYLENNPGLRLEWESNHKLKNDPRVFWFGKILRRFSLDELPQLINVFKGEMSLVGPRPIVPDEILHYGDRFDPYTWVKPGITGLWQISGRNDTTYKERVSLDEYYIRNWSIWLDFYVLSRTVGMVILGTGAY
jgi:Undecaprenyl-phosphate galactose phosphotransferase WbaP